MSPLWVRWATVDTIVEPVAARRPVSRRPVVATATNGPQAPHCCGRWIRAKRTAVTAVATHAP